MKAAFRDYTKWKIDRHFAVSPDGRAFGISTCGHRCAYGGVRVALESCEKRAARPCKILARDDEILWENAPGLLASTWLNDEVCENALDEKRGFHEWSTDPSHEEYVAEAERRDFDIVECRKHIWRLHTGAGPIDMDSTVRQAFARYRKTDRPQFFAISQDGKTADFTSCRFGFRACAEEEVSIALKRCQKGAAQPCKIYANEGIVVWRTEAVKSFPGMNTEELCEQGLWKARYSSRWTHVRKKHPYAAAALRRGLTRTDCEILLGYD